VPASSRTALGSQLANGAAAGPTNTLFFTAGIADEADGLFGAITPVTSTSNAPEMVETMDRPKIKN